MIKKITDKCHLSYIKNNLPSVFFLFLFLAVNLSLIVYSVVKYRQQNGFVVVARACGLCLNFTSSFILLLVLRRSLSWMRSNGWSDYLPIDEFIYFHKLTGCFTFVYGVAHSVMHVWNFASIVGRNHLRKLTDDESANFTQNVTDISPVSEDFSLYEYLFTLKPGIGWVGGSASVTGWCLLAIIIVIVIAAHPCVRRSHMFEVFFFTHLLFVPYYLLLIIHAPSFWKWFLIPMTLYFLETCNRLREYYTRRGKTYICQASLLPSKVTHLVIRRPVDFVFEPGDYIFLNIPRIAKYEWHPFTISSAPEMDGYISLHIRGVGEWTNTLYDYFDLQSKAMTSNHGRVSRFSLSSKSRGRRSAVELNNKTDLNRTSKRLNRPVNNASLNRAFDISSESGGDGSNSTCIDLTAIFTESDGRRTNVAKQNSLQIDDLDIRTRVLSPGGGVQLRSQQELSRSLSAGIISHQNNINRNVNLLRSFTDSNYNKMILDASKRLSLYASNLRDSGCFYLRKKPNIITVPVVEENQQPDESIPEMEQESPRSSGQFGPDDANKDHSVIIDEGYPGGGGEIRLWHQPVPVYIMGPYGSPSSQIFRAEHAVLIATGIGVTPFASILQSIMNRYRDARVTCSHCNHSWIDKVPLSVMKLRKVDFFWINRDQHSFEWFLKLLSQLEIEQTEMGCVDEDHFLDLHMYITSALQKTDVKAVFLQMALELMHQKEKRDKITGLKTRTKPGRPDWDNVLKDIARKRKGKVTVFFCGSPQLGRIIRKKCNRFGFNFKKEKF
ncbi:NOX5 (predicted) [Pycnogonum litorale]